MGPRGMPGLRQDGVGRGGPATCRGWWSAWLGGEGARGCASVTSHVRRWVSRVSECGLQEAGTQRQIWAGHLAELSARGSQ